ncbi:MAG: hypothetical protein AB4372_15905 [Xenococcus sp. (in: cyanobacteria)]
MSIDKATLMEYFLDLSVALTGFSRFDLEGTGQASLYFDTVYEIIDEEVLTDLLETFHNLDSSDPSAFAEELDSQILTSAKRGPLARNILKLWYTSTWEQMPPAWQNWYGNGKDDKTFIPSSAAYPEGLVWRTVGVNPPGAKPPGYGTWSEPPSVSLS